MSDTAPVRLYGALDLAKSTGATIGIPFESPKSATWVLGGESRHERFVSLKSYLIPWLQRWQPIKVFLEEPMRPHIMVRNGATIDTQLQLTGLVAIAEMLCEEQGVATKIYPRADVLMHFTGRRGYKEENGGKKACVARCFQLGYNIEGYDQGDAAALWDYGCSMDNAKTYKIVGADRPMPARETTDGYVKPRGRGGRRPSRRNTRKVLPLFK